MIKIVLTFLLIMVALALLAGPAVRRTIALPVGPGGIESRVIGTGAGGEARVGVSGGGRIGIRSAALADVAEAVAHPGHGRGPHEKADQQRDQRRSSMLGGYGRPPRGTAA